MLDLSFRKIIPKCMSDTVQLQLHGNLQGGLKGKVGVDLLKMGPFFFGPSKLERNPVRTGRLCFVGFKGKPRGGKTQVKPKPDTILCTGLE